jgi:hypothetical protein
MTEQAFTYRPRPVVDHRKRDNVRKVVQGARTAEKKKYAPVPERMQGRVVRKDTGYAAKVYVTGVPFHGPVRTTPELAHEDWRAYFERAQHLHQLCVSSGISAKDLNRGAIAAALRS